MLDGGLYHSDQPQESIGIPYHHAMALQRRRNYVGERTGWTVNSNSATTTTDRQTQILQRLLGPQWNWNNTKTAFAEVLYAARPLLWAWLESRYHALPTTVQSRPLLTNNPLHNTSTSQSNKRRNLFRGWLLCLAMDLLSIRMLEQRPRQQNYKTDASSSPTSTTIADPFRSAELKRRKVRLLLYLLRSPIWSQQTLPALEGLSQTVLAKLPLVGNLLDTVLWDWILYYQHPFVAEEG